VLLLLAATLVVFGRSVAFDFVLFDDNLNVYANPHLTPPTWDSFVHYGTHLYFNVYMPVTWVVWLLTAAVAYLPGTPAGTPPLNPYVYHAVSAATHVFAVAFCYLVLRQLRFDPWAACAGALVFALHPLQVEAVGWISAYNVVLSGALAMLAIWLYLRFADTTDPRLRRIRYAGATLAFAAALLSKPLAITVPFMIIAIDVFLLRRPWRATLRAMAPWIAVGVTLAVLTTTWQGKSVPIQPWPVWTRPFIAADAFSFYLRNLLWPAGLTIDHGRTPMRALMDHGLLWKVLLPVVLLAILWLWRDRVRPVLAGLLIGAAGMLPVLGLAPFDFQQFSTVADRYAYLGVFGAAVVAAWLASLVRADRSRAWACVALAALLGSLTWTQLGHWRDSEALFARTTSANPRSGVAWLNWGTYLINEDRPVEAADRLRQAVALLYDYHDARVNLGTALYNMGDVAGARRERERMVVMFPKSVASHLAMGDFHADTGHPEAAAAAYRAALALSPSDAVLQKRLARVTPRLAATTTAPATPQSNPAPGPEPRLQ
jgi:Tfp pilus assembly protein PilF